MLKSEKFWDMLTTYLKKTAWAVRTHNGKKITALRDQQDGMDLTIYPMSFPEPACRIFGHFPSAEDLNREK